MGKDFGSESLWIWIVKKAAVNNPYKKETWTAAVTLGGMDIYGEGSTIQLAYKDLQKQIEESKHLFTAFANLK